MIAIPVRDPATEMVCPVSFVMNMNVPNSLRRCYASVDPSHVGLLNYEQFDYY